MSCQNKTEIFKCPYCNNNYKNPRIVECGASFCMTCIELLINADEQGFICPGCKLFHTKPTNESKLGKLAMPGVFEIKNYCDKLRNEVTQHSDELVENIKKLNLKLVEEIDEYEKNSTLGFNENNNLNFKLFTNNVFVFKKSRIQPEMSVIGRLTIDYSELFKCLSAYNLCELNQNVKKTTIIGQLTVKFLNRNGKICIVYHKRDGLKNIGIYDRNLRLLANQDIAALDNDYGMIRVAVTENNSIFVCLSNDHNATERNKSSLVLKYDGEIKLTKRVKLNYETLSFERSNNELFILPKEGNTVYVYDQDLNDINKFGQIINKELVRNFKITLNYYVLFFYDFKFVSLMDKNNFKSEKKYFIDLKKFFSSFYGDYDQDFFTNEKTNNMLVYSTKLKELYVYDLDNSTNNFCFSLDCMPDFSLMLGDFREINKLIFCDSTKLFVFF